MSGKCMNKNYLAHFKIVENFINCMNDEKKRKMQLFSTSSLSLSFMSVQRTVFNGEDNDRLKKSKCTNNVSGSFRTWFRRKHILQLWMAKLCSLITIKWSFKERQSAMMRRQVSGITVDWTRPSPRGPGQRD